MANLKAALLFLHVAELRQLCMTQDIPSQGNKIILIARILHFISTGEIIKEPKMPAISKASHIAILEAWETERQKPD